MKIAVVGAGVSGLLAAHRLTTQGHDVSVFEASDRCGGHTQAVSLKSSGVRGPIEAGFLVFNEAACPRFAGLLAELDTPTREIRVAFEIRHPHSGRVFRGASLRDLLNDPLNLIVPSMYLFLPDWVRFTRKARRLLQSQHEPSPTTLGQFLSNGFYSRAFVEQFIYPLAGSVNPVGRQKLAEMPLAMLLAFIRNHGLLKLTRELSCRMLTGGSHEYVQRLTDPIRKRIHLNCPVAAIARHDNHVLLKFPHRSRERYEQVVLAVHADVALRLLADPTRPERQVLESFDYAPQIVYIHMEDRQREPSPAGAIWRFQPSMCGQAGVALSYRISQVQDVDAPDSLMLTMLGAGHPPPPHVMRSIRFRRPVFSAKSVLAQRRFDEINGRRRTFFCGSYWGHGFHEDAIRSAEEVAERLGQQTEQPLAATVRGSSAGSTAFPRPVI